MPLRQDRKDLASSLPVEASALSLPGEGYRRLVECSPDGILVYQDARLVFVNRAAVQLLGASAPDQLIGRSVLEIFQAESQVPIHELAACLPAGQTMQGLEAQVVKVDGGLVDVEVTGTRLEDPETMIQLIVRDISDRKRAEVALRESEERLALAFAGAQEGVWDWNLETGAVVYSPRWKEMLGYSDGEIEPHVSAWERLLHPDDWPRALHLNESVVRGEGRYEAEFRLRHKAGHYIHVLTRGLPVRRTPDGPVVRIVGTHFDLTERKQVEEMLRRAHGELEARVRERTTELALANESLRREMLERERAERARRSTENARPTVRQFSASAATLPNTSTELPPHSAQRSGL